MLSDYFEIIKETIEQKYPWIILIILILLIFYQVIKKILFKSRFKYALKAGKLEHFCGRLTGILIAFDTGLFYFRVNYNIVLSFLIITFFIWLTYLLSHKAEKKLYPRNFRF